MTDAWGRCRDVLGRYGERVALTRLPDGGLQIVIAPDKRAAWKVSGLVIGFVVLAFAGGFFAKWIGPLGPSPAESTGSRLRIRHELFFGLGFAGIGFGVVAILLRGVSGPGRDYIYEVREGQVKVDRYQTGDHIVRVYAAAEVGAVCVMDSSITIETAVADVPGPIFVPIDLNLAVAEVVGRVLWGEAARVARDVPMRKAASGKAKLVVVPARD